MKVREVDLSVSRETLARLDVAIFPDDPRVDLEGRRWWIAYTDAGEPVAFAGLRAGAGCFYLSRAGVLPAWRRLGLHTRLIRARLRAARAAAPGTAIATYTAIGNVASANALERCGFRYWRPRVSWWAPDGDEGFVYWRRFV